MPYTLDQTAKLLHVGRNTMTRTLRQRGVFDSTNKPQGRYSGAGYFVVCHKAFRHPVKGDQVYHRTLVTSSGLLMIGRMLGTSQLTKEKPTLH